MAAPPLSRIDTFIEKQLGLTLNERNALSLQTSRAPRETNLTFDDPHSCKHCENESIQFEAQRPQYICFECLIQVPTCPVSCEQICSQCSTASSGEIEFIYSAAFEYGVEEILSAADSGCALHQFFVDCLVRRFIWWDEWDRADIKSQLSAGKFKLTGCDFSSHTNTGCCLSVLFETGHSPEPNCWAVIEGWSTENSRSSRYISARPYEQDVNSPSSWNFARDNLRICRESHLRCRGGLTDAVDLQHPTGFASLEQESISIQDVPTRLLDVRAANGTMIRLVEVHSMSEIEKYDLSLSGFVALSYCWGGQQRFTLTTKSSGQILDGFNAPQLPQTIRDAVRVVEKLDLRYLWVDALCIYQDNEKDKENEIARMAQYYGNAAVTICAAASSSAEQGFLFRRTFFPFAVGPIRLPLLNKDGTSEGHVYLLEEAKKSSQPITTRGWTLQESLLSRRLLIYDERQLYWCCLNSFAGCGGQYPALSDRISGNEQTLVANIHPMGSLLDLPIFTQWNTMVSNYTSRHLGCPEDKLLAISSLAANLMELCDQRDPDYFYIAGLLGHSTDDAVCHIQLLWRSLNASKTHRAVTYRSPSWSWAAVDGPIEPDDSDIGPHDWLRPQSKDENAVVENYKVTLKFPNIPFGSVTDGFLVLEAKVQRLPKCMANPRCSAIRFPGDERENFPGVSLNIYPDTSQDLNEIRGFVLKRNASSIEFFLVPIQLSDQGACGKGIICQSNDSGELSRVGFFAFTMPAGLSKEIYTPGLFSDAVFSSVKLV